VQPLKVPEKSPQAWTEPQIYKLFHGLSQIPLRRQMGGLPLRDWLVCFHLILWDTGERLTAALKIRLVDIDLETGWLRIRAENRKGQTRDMPHQLDGETLIRVRRFIAIDPGREFLFPLDCCLTTLFSRYRKLLKGMGLPHGRESMFHRMRRSVVSHAKAAGGNATRIADHASEETTRKSYEDPTIVIRPQAKDFLFRPFRNDEPEPPRAA
jgi:integrase